MDYRVVSADSHIDLDYMPERAFVDGAPAQWRERMPRVVEIDERLEWWVDGRYVAPASRGAKRTWAVRKAKGMVTPENQARVDRFAATGFYDDAEKGLPHPTTAHLRVKDQQLDSVDAEVMYGLTFLGSPDVWKPIQGGSSEVGKGSTLDPELIGVIYRVYNDWLADFCKEHPERLIGLACLPNHDPEAAASEVRRVAALGLKGAVLDVQGAAKPIYHDDWDAVWSAASECHLPISFHVVAWYPRMPAAQDADKYLSKWWNLYMVLSPLMGAEFLNSIIISGACERFPEFKFVLGECGATWVPYLLDRMDHECTGFPGLALNPSDYWRRQGYTTYQDEGLIGDLVEFVGVDNVMWGSDYPHPDSVWPDSQQVIESNLKRVKDEAVRRKLVCDNVSRLYGLK